MSRKDYILIAEAFHYAALSVADKNDPTMEDNQFGGIRLAFDYVTERLARENVRFDRDKFHNAVYNGVNRS